MTAAAHICIDRDYFMVRTMAVRTFQFIVHAVRKQSCRFMTLSTNLVTRQLGAITASVWCPFEITVALEACDVRMHTGYFVYRLVAVGTGFELGGETRGC